MRLAYLWQFFLLFLPVVLLLIAAVTRNNKWLSYAGRSFVLGLVLTVLFVLAYPDLATLIAS